MLWCDWKRYKLCTQLRFSDNLLLQGEQCHWSIVRAQLHVLRVKSDLEEKNLWVIYGLTLLNHQLRINKDLWKCPPRAWSFWYEKDKMCHQIPKKAFFTGMYLEIKFEKKSKTTTVLKHTHTHTHQKLCLIKSEAAGTRLHSRGEDEHQRAWSNSWSVSASY